MTLQGNGKRIREKEQLHRDPSWGVSSWSYILGTPVLGSSTKKTSLLAGWRAGRTNRRALESLDYTCKEYAHLLAYSQIDREEDPKSNGLLASFPSLQQERALA